MTRQNSMIENGKYTNAVIDFVDDYWYKNIAPPTLREIMEATGCRSASHASRILKMYPGMSMVKGKPVPEWVKERIRGES